MSRGSGLDQGFALFDDPFAGGELATTDDQRQERPAEEVVTAALRWLDKRPPGPFFVWVHVYDPHVPYLPPEPWRKRFAKSPYDGEVAYADAQLGRLVDWLDKSGLRGNTLVVATSDHGEGLGDHGEDEHLVFIYDTTLKVPAILSWPGRLPAGSRVAGQFRSIDFVSTILDLLGQPASENSGASRAAALRGQGKIPDNESYAESLYGELHFGWAPLRGLRGEGWKLIDAPRPEIYRLTEDPHERQNLLEAQPRVAAGMRARLQTYDRGEGAKAAAAHRDPGAEERLAALGYVGGAFFEGPPSGADPKDKIAEFQANRGEVVEALRRYKDRDVDGALKILERLARDERAPSGDTIERRSFNVSYTFGRALLDKRRYREAILQLEKAIELYPTGVPAYVYLAQAYGGTGALANALTAIDRGLKRAPRSAQLLQVKGSLQLRQGDAAAARATLEQAREADPKSALVRVDLAAIYRNAGELKLAATEADEAARLEPSLPEAQVARGLVLGAQGREAEAADALRKALALRDDQADGLFYLAAIELRAGRAAEAVPLLERLVARHPGYPDAKKTLVAARAAVPSSARPATSGRATGTGGSKARAGPAVRLLLLRVATRQQADELVRQLEGGSDFGDLALAHSLDPSKDRRGDLGVVTVADLADPLRSVAARLNPGETSLPDRDQERLAHRSPDALSVSGDSRRRRSRPASPGPGRYRGVRGTLEPGEGRPRGKAGLRPAVPGCARSHRG